ncbi:MAG: pyruvate:ferredoxin (flavodoxin) oxidoreductase [Candidatus Eremiobacteraeota bacterium]|nr:pyruvate:ferredoxin (flavodoxin) oxidoreductase [Candidatus Eremiobacteraeota bacterium]
MPRDRDDSGSRRVTQRVTLDGNTAVAHVAYRVNEVCAIFPITPSSTMAELADEWASNGVKNIWGGIPVVQEMQSEGGAAGAVHGSLQSGALTTTFTASQGLLLMLPNMFKIAGELTSAVFHVAARTIATHALSIFGDHSDVMAARATGFAFLSSGSVQEAHDLALVAQAATLEGRVPIVHFFDGFRTSHEVNTIDLLDAAQIRAMIDDELVRKHRARALNPERPFIRGTSHNPDTFFQAAEGRNPYYAAMPAIVQRSMDRFAQLTGRKYALVEYSGDPKAERVVVVMGSGAQTVRETVEYLRARGERVGLVQVRLYRPFPAGALLAVLPTTCTSVAVLDRAKEPGALGEPLYLDVVTALAQARTPMPRVIGGRYGLSSKDFNPAMARAIFDELAKKAPKNGFTIGIEDDVSGTSLRYDADFDFEQHDVVRAVFYGLGSDGTVGANKDSVKIIGTETDLYAQAYFVYDAHKSGAQTISHLRFGPRPICAPYLIGTANFVACHRFDFLLRTDMLRVAAAGATFLLNSPYRPHDVWEHLPESVRRAIVEKALKFYVIDASRVARESGLGGRTNTVLQTCFFALSNVLPKDEAIVHIKHAIEKSYGKRGNRKIVDANFAAVDRALAELHAVSIPTDIAVSNGSRAARPGWTMPESAPTFVREVTAKMLAGLGDELPVSAIPVDGTFPSGTTAFEKRNVADIVATWDADMCIQCGKCSFVCPHSIIRGKYYDKARLAGAPETFKSAPINARGYPDVRFSLGFYAEDCTGCGLCVEVCPASNPLTGKHAVDLAEKAPLLNDARRNIAFFEELPVNDRSRVDFANVRGVQFLEPTFEFPGACEGCGETPYLKVLSQLFGDRMQVANATGCSSIYGANLPATPWSVNSEGRGPSWSNSLFEDDAEFGLGFRLAIDQQTELARDLLREHAAVVGDVLAEGILFARQVEESEIRAQRERVARLKEKLLELKGAARTRDLLSVADFLIKRSVWIVGGDGWAYDIGYGGLDHVLASSRDVNVLVLDTGVYSNTGGQASKSTPLGAIAKFAAAGKRIARKDLALQAIQYGNVYVAQVAMGANPQHTLLAFREAEAYDGPSLILAYSHCIAHGIDMRKGLTQQDLAVASGYWPLFRYNPVMRKAGETPFCLDSPRPTISLRDYAYNEIRYKALTFSRPAEAEAIMAAAQAGVTEKYRHYEELATLEGHRFPS